MSRIGKKPIILPKGVELKISGSNVSVKGPKGELKRDLHSSMQIVAEGDQWLVKPVVDNGESRKFHGLTRTLVANMVEGVSAGFSKTLTLVGVGYRAQATGKEVNLTLGYSHPIVYKMPEGIDVKVDKQTTVIVSGADKEMVGQVAANIRSFRKPEPYHGKGVRYENERIISKVGKSGSK
jgi:large subunit ribosomal protein L6